MTTGEALTPGTSPALQRANDAAHTSVPSRVRLAATADDFGRLALGSIGALILALGYLFWRTSWGAVDATAFDTAIGAAVLLAPAPTWLAWMLAGALDDGATPGQHRRGIGVRFASADWPGIRLLRFGIHPLSAPGWLWFAAIMYLLDAPLLSWLFLLLAAVVTLSGLGSMVLILIGRQALHDLVLRSNVEVAQ